ncbi:MAG: bifunctional methylenetetrahydrofolate dehydrogenase/methenyltetrahydrofolate cyclohydrolase FolD [Nitrospira sp.]|nr:bifunctional methylenetetrahydrofolate dehydrogenase/methenyltetrahydrofolate cyclohydrolase FolD [Nitrospira sp.]
MAGIVMDGKAISKEIKEKIRKEAENLKSQRVVPGLAAVLVGENAASVIYVRNKRKACEESGIYSEGHYLPESTSQAELLDLVDRLNKDPKIHGILVQLPLPKHLSTDLVLNSLSPFKDVDGLHPYNVGKLMMGDPIFVPCTPAGAMAMLDHHRIPIEGKTAVVVGRSNLVGRPVAMLLMHRNATVTVCHSRTQNLPDVCRRADILIAAIGKAQFVAGEMIKDGAAVIDVGINRLGDGRLVGDVDYDAAAKRAGWITPVPGGVGPMTIAMLLQNTLLSAKRATGKM